MLLLFSQKMYPCTFNNKNLQLVHYDRVGADYAALSGVPCILLIFIALVISTAPNVHICSRELSNN